MTNRGIAVVPLIITDIYELAGRLRKRGDDIAATVGQTQARWQVMSAASGQPMSVPQIARRLGLTRQAVQRTADLLVDEGLAGYAGNPDHRASPHLILTKRGREALGRLTATARAGNEALGSKLGALDLPALRRDLRRLLVALDGSARFNGGE
jgi:DNA-binding MarR family transcriptional regulator